MNFDYIKHTILLTLAGSRAYGTFGPDSDYDYRGIIIPPTVYYKSCMLNFEQKEGLEGFGDDSVAYDIRKFMKLAMENNPNVLETLFAPDHLLKINTKYGQKIRDNRYLFLSKKARHTLSGYCFAQLKRMKQHKAWWDKELAGEVPPKPERKDFGLDAQPRFPKDVLNHIITVPTELLNPDLIDYMNRERRYFELKKKYDSWLDWKTNRNAARFLLEKENGYDGKHAMHLVRLMTMCEEVLTTGELRVERPDAELLKSIKHGAWTYDYIVKWAEDKDKEMDELYAKSTLQHEPQRKQIDQLCIDIISEATADGW